MTFNPIRFDCDGVIVSSCAECRRDTTCCCGCCCRGHGHGGCGCGGWGGCGCGGSGRPPGPPAPGMYNVTYDANGGVGSFTDREQGYTVRTAHATGIRRQGYMFTAWNTMPDGSGTYYYPGSNLPIMGNTVLYAVWTPVA